MKALTLLAALLFFSGCGTTYQYNSDSESSAARSALNNMIGKDCSVRTNDGNLHSGRMMGLSNDSLFLLDDGGGKSTSVPKDRVQTVSAEGSRVTTIITGVFVGGAFGALIGKSTSPGGWKILSSGSDQEAKAGALAGAIAGGLIGGFAFPNRTTVNFSRESSVDAGSPPELLGILIPGPVEETDATITFVYSGKTIRLSKRHARLERRENGVMVWATREAFQSAGLTFPGREDSAPYPDPGDA